MKTKWKMFIALGSLPLLAGFAFGSLVVSTGSNWTYTPAADSLITSRTPSAVVNVSANAEGSPGPEVMTDGLVADGGRYVCYTIGNNAVLTYSLGDNPWGYELTGLNFYTYWANRDNITITAIEYETVDNPGTWISVPGAALNYVGGPKCYAKYSDTEGLVASYVGSVRISFGAQENNYVGYIELEITGTAEAAPDFFPVPGPTLADPVTGSTGFTGTNHVDVADFPLPGGLDQWLLAEDGTPAAIAGGTWASTNTPPSEADFALPAGDADIVLYAWFTNSTESVLLRRGASQTLRYTTVAPSVSVQTPYVRGLPSGGSVVVEPWHVDTGTIGGTSTGTGVDDLPVPLAFLGLEVVSGPGTDQDASDETVTLNQSGAYVLRFLARNEAGNESTTNIALTITDVAAGPYVWTGGAGTTTWTEPLNWDLNAAPGAGDDIVVNSGTTWNPVLAAGTYPESGAYGSFTVNAGALVVCQGDPTVVNEASGGTTAVPHGIGVTINAASAVIDGTLSADYQGFHYQQGPAGNREGASHGGVNYNGYEYYDPTAAYGSIQQPTALGSGGSGDAPGAASGGGAIKLDVTGSLVVDGLVTAKGYSRGAGGSLWLIADTLSGTGEINADGNNGGQGGGGGRVAIAYTSSTFTGTVSVKGGDTGSSDGSEGTLWEPGRFASLAGAPGAPADIALGSSYSYVFPDQTPHYWNLSVTNGARVELHGGNLVIGTLTLNGASTLRFDSWFPNCPADMAGLTISNLNVLGTSVLCLPTSANVAEYDLDALSIASGAKVYLGWGDKLAVNAASGGTAAKPHGAGTRIIAAQANVAGLLSAKGRGFGMSLGPIYSTEGNGHGGRTDYNTGYGRLARPSALGAGRDVFGGGGAIRLTVSGTLAFDGTVSADARDGRSGGGSVWIQAGTLTGTGLATARGGLDARPGAGGRVAVESVDDSGFTGQIKVTGRFGQHNNKSYPGTVFLAELANADAFAADGGVDLDATYAKSVSDGTVFTEYTTNGTNFDIEDAIVVMRTVTRWNADGYRYAWTESCTKKASGAPIDNTVAYSLSGLPADMKFAIEDNGVPLDAQPVWMSDAEGVLAFTVPLGTIAHTVEVRPWSPDATFILLR